MIINIDENTRVSTYAYGWQIEERLKKPREGRPGWEGVSFFATPSQAVKHLLMQGLYAADVEGLANCIAECRRQCDELTNILEARLKMN